MMEQLTFTLATARQPRQLCQPGLYMSDVLQYYVPELGVRAVLWCLR
ncbi:MAG: hypothetical protein U5N85_12485 [Arcicella sp.]|nr:hypothetical protein [Arcicella sp.]